MADPIHSNAKLGSSEQSIYQKLRADKEEIRILDVLLGHDQVPIAGTLRIVSLSERPHFHALSYVWGDSVERTPIQVNGQAFHVTLNLASALRALRSDTKIVTMWIDAVCINQSDPAERKEQVGLMRKIYGNATHVHIWLGEFSANWRDELPDCYSRGWYTSRDPESDDDRIRSVLGGVGCDIDPTTSPKREKLELTGTIRDVDLVLQHFEDVETRTLLHRLPFYRVDVESNSGATHAKFNEEWHIAMGMVVWILSRAWWQRAWTIQEAVVPKTNPLVHIGSHTIPLYRILNIAVHMNHWTLAENNLSEVLLAGTCFHFNVASQEMIEAEALSIGIFRKRIHVTHQLPDFRDLLVASQRRRASDPRDILYSILGLLPEDQALEADYTVEFIEVCCRATILSIASGGLVQWIYDAVGVNSEQHPSWAIKLDNPGCLHHRIQFGGYCSDTQDLKTSLEWTSRCSLALKGAEIDVVAEIAAAGNNIPDGEDMDIADLQHVIQQYQLTYDLYGIQQTSLALWRTILCHKVPLRGGMVYGSKKMSDAKVEYYVKLFRDGVRRELHNATLTAHEEIEWQLLKGEIVVSHSRYEFFCCKAGSPGMGPRGIQLSDKIFFLRGCSIPVILRDTRGSKASDTPIYSFVGPCYIDGWIGGADDEHVAAKRLNAEWHDITLV